MSSQLPSTKLSQAEYELLSKGRDADPCKSWSINTTSYIDPKYQAIEREQIFSKTWQFVCHEEKLRNSGDYVAVEVAGQPIVVTRNKGGQLHAFYNVCKHRGHLIKQGEGNSPHLTCPYHSWVYSLEGDLEMAPRAKLVDSFDKQVHCLDAVQVENFCHLIFVNLDLEAASLAQQSGDLAKEIKAYAPDLADLTYATRLTYRIKANWKSVTDNFLECYHCAVAHKDFVSLVELDTYKVTTHGIYSSHMAKARVLENAAYSIDDASVTDHAVWYLWPNTTLMRYPGRGNFMVWKFHPDGPEQTYEEFDFFFETADVTDAEKQALAFIDDVLQVEDINLVESVQRGMRTPAFNSGRFMSDPDRQHGMSEHAVHHFHGLLLDAYQGAVEE